MFSCDPIPGNVNLHAREFHGEPYYDIPALTTDQRFRDSLRLIRQYSLLPFMTPRQFYYPRVVLEFYRTMTSWGVPSRLELRFSIEWPPGSTLSCGHYSCLVPASSAGKFCRIQGLAPAITKRDGPLSRSRYYSGTHTLPHAAFATDAPSGPLAPDQLIPTIALCTAQGSYTRGSVQDLRGILV